MVLWVPQCSMLGPLIFIACTDSFTNLNLSTCFDVTIYGDNGIIQAVGSDSNLPPAAQLVAKNYLPTRVDFLAPGMIVQLELMLIQKIVQALPHTCSHSVNPLR